MSRSGKGAGNPESESNSETALDDLIPILREVVSRPGPLIAFQQIAHASRPYSQVRTATKLPASQFSRALKVLQEHALLRRSDSDQGEILALSPRGVALDELLVLMPAAFEDFERAANRGATR